MKLTLTLFCLVLCSIALKAEAAPKWMSVVNDAIERPAHMTDAEQSACTESILLEMNRHFNTSFTKDDVAPIQMANWDHPEAGFIRGGGYNIRVVKTLSSNDESTKHIKAARYTNLSTTLEMGAQPSLHVEGKVDGQELFNKEESSDNSTVSYDMVAHSDSAYAFLPAGVILHFFEDVLGAKSRRPCPVEGDVEKELKSEAALLIAPAPANPVVAPAAAIAPAAPIAPPATTSIETPAAPLSATGSAS